MGSSEGTSRAPASRDRLPLLRRAPSRGDRRTHRRQHGRGTPRRSRWHQEFATDLFRGRAHGRSTPMTDITPSVLSLPGDDGKAAERVALFPIEHSAMADFRTRLAALAGEHGLLDVAYRTIDTPVGPLLLAATETGLVRVAYEREGFDTVLESLATKISPRVLEAPR